VFAALSFAAQASESSISLAGEWRFRLDPQHTGAAQHWEQQPVAVADRIFLPGSTDQAGYGTKTSGPEKGWLSRPYTYEGPAWYETDVVIPGTWTGKRITLFLERAHWQTQAFVDGRPFGTRDSLSVPHVYDLSAGLAPGRHRLTLCIDNSYIVDVGRNAHSVTDHTQTNWNGVVGRIELQATDPVWIESVKVTPSGGKLSLVVTIGNATGKPVSGHLNSQAFAITGTLQEVQLTEPLPEGRWGEFHPSLFDASVWLFAGQYRDERHVQYSVRDLTARDGQFILNGRPIFLRGTVECNIFPLTGYPPTNVESWMRIFRIARSYGLNHFRFHSNCPPEAAFVAADRLGFLLQVELPVWTRINNNQKTMDYMRAEGLRILEAYGNHPSFAMLGMGNEFSDGWTFLDELIKQFRSVDPRHLYTFSADHNGRGPSAESDYYVGNRIGAAPAGRMRIHGSRFGNEPGSTDYDFSRVIESVKTPVVAHELGQWVVFPDYREIGSYAGVLKPRNLEAFRAQLAERGMADQDVAFQQASGKFAWILYKEEIETALRTPHYGGVQLLQLEDFPGQGEALVGLLDSFWHSKGILKPEEFREFYAPTVPLLRFAKFTWTNDETFTAKAEVAHYGETDLPITVGAWTARDDSGREIGRAALQATNVKVGGVATLGEIKLRLKGLTRASRVRIELALLKGTEVRNHWDLWVYPKQVDTTVPSGITIAHAYDDAARKALASGGKLLLLWPPKRESANTLPTHFLPVFWSLSWFKQQPGTLGILCDPKHPALAGFPTEEHSNYQWWDMTQNSRAFILDDTPSMFRPIVQVIDDYHRNHKLGAIFEARVGDTKLLVCGFDLETDLDHRLAARQLRASLLAYMNSRDFNPTVALDLARILQ
jgi:hypothetical protein